MASTARIRIIKVIDDGALAEQIVPRMQNLGNALGRRMQRLVPKRTWALHDTITNMGTENRNGLVTVSVGFGGATQSGKRVDYGLHVEYGTSKMAAQPFARPALYQTRPADMLTSQELDQAHGGA